MAQLMVILLFSLLLPSTLYAGTTLKDLPLQPNSVLNPLAGNPGIEYGVPGIAGSPDNGESFQISEERKIIAHALQQASAEFNIPLRILQGIAFVQSRWSQIVPHGPSDTPPSYGVMGLRDDDWFGHSLVKAASLIGETPEKLKVNPVSNIRGGAALLASLADDERAAGGLVDQHLETWKRVVERYSGIRSPTLAESFAFEVFHVIRDGYHDLGINIDAQSDLDMTIFSEKVRELGGFKKNSLLIVHQLSSRLRLGILVQIGVAQSPIPIVHPQLAITKQGGEVMLLVK